MLNKIHFFINSKHSIGGVTTWSFQTVNFLKGHYDAKVVALNYPGNKCESGHLFHKQMIELHATSSYYVVNINEEKKQFDKPTLPLDELAQTTNIIKSSDTNLSLRWEGLHKTLESVISQSNLFVQSYMDFSYRLAAISRIKGFPSRCIGTCHTDHDSYYNLLKKYDPIIHSFIAVSSRCARKLIDYLPHREGDIHFLPYGVEVPSFNRNLILNEPIRLLYSGRFDKDQKQIFCFIDLIKELEKN